MCDIIRNGMANDSYAPSSRGDSHCFYVNKHCLYKSREVTYVLNATII